MNGRFSGEKPGGITGIQSLIALNDADGKKIKTRYKIDFKELIYSSILFSGSKSYRLNFGIFHKILIWSKASSWQIFPFACKTTNKTILSGTVQDSDERQLSGESIIPMKAAVDLHWISYPIRFSHGSDN